VLRTNPLRKKEGTEVAKGKKKTSARKPYTAADVKLLKQHSKGKNASAEDCKADEEDRRLLKTKGPEVGNWTWLSAMIIAQPAASFDELAAGKAPRCHAG
jgi:hypothetical protein